MSKQQNGETLTSRSQNTLAAEVREGTVITFYSYKGGVGRSMVLANIAWILATKYGKKVLVVDWDLEAPGLHRFFKIPDQNLRPGVIDYLISYKNAVKRTDPPFSEQDISISEYLQPVGSFFGGGSIQLMSAGSHEDRRSYVENVRSFNWNEFYNYWNGGQLIEALRKQFRNTAEYTLIDSRTGITDNGGICTVQLPDTVVFVFIFNEQNLNGIEQIAAELSDRSNPNLIELQRWPRFHFIAGRRDVSEAEQLLYWEREAEKKLRRFCHMEVITKFGDVLTYLREMSVPYKPYFSYDEHIAAETELGFEITKSLTASVDLLLEGKVASAVDAVERNTRAIRASLQKRIGIGAGGLAIIVAGAATALALGAFGGSSASTFLELPFRRIALALAIGAGSGIVGALTSFLIPFSGIEPKGLSSIRISSVWLSAAIQASLGALLGMLTAALLEPSRFSPLFAFAAGFLWSPIAQGIREAQRRSASKPAG